LGAGVEAVLGEDVDLAPLARDGPDAVREAVVHVADAVAGGERIAEKGDEAAARRPPQRVLDVVPHAEAVHPIVALEPAPRGERQPERIGGVVEEAVIAFEGAKDDDEAREENEHVSGEERGPGGTPRRHASALAYDRRCSPVKRGRPPCPHGPGRPPLAAT